MVGYITCVMTGSVKPSGGKTANQVSREPERFELPWSTELCAVTLDILSARHFRKGVDITMQIQCFRCSGNGEEWYICVLDILL